LAVWREGALPTGPTHMLRHIGPPVERIQRGEVDPTFIITHRLPLEETPQGRELFKHRERECITVCCSRRGQAAGGRRKGTGR